MLDLSGCQAPPEAKAKEPCTVSQDSCGPPEACDLPPASLLDAGSIAVGAARDDAAIDGATIPSAEAGATPGGESIVSKPTTVSITFDDTFIDQMKVKDALRAAGLRATFYVNSARIGEDTYMTEAMLHALEADGHEIAGHTVNHPNLPTVDPDEQRRQICNDRFTLLRMGFRVTSLAYPHGAYSPVTQEIAAACGYNSARSVGSLGCDGCPGGESMAPRDPFAIRTPVSIKCNTTLDAMKNQVLAAERGSGGWVPIVLHHVCNRCGRNSVPPATLIEFFGWLAARAARGTVVRTVHELIGGDVKPGVPGPPAPLREVQRGNILRNPGFEEDADGDGTPDCWLKGGDGANTFTFGRVPDAHTGSFAERLEVTAFTSGARRILTRQDLGFCAPLAQAGHRYALAAWYKSTTAPRFSVYYREPSGFWKYWTQSRLLPVCGAWCEARWTIPEALPADADSISVSLTLDSVGAITMDDFTLVDTSE